MGPRSSSVVVSPIPARVRRARGWRLVGTIVALVGATPSLARAEPEAEPGWIRQWTDFREDLQSDHLERRLRAIARLGASSEPRSRAALLSAVRELEGNSEPSPARSAHTRPARTSSPPTSSRHFGPAARARLRLAMARALAHHVDQLESRQALVRLMSAAADGAHPHDGMAVRTAALLLARHGSVDATQALARALWQSPALARAARDALVAYPPERLEPLLETGRPEALLELLGELHDQRAFDYLRQAVRETPPPHSATAAWSLFRLGFSETRELAHHWWARSQDPAQRLVSLRILLEMDDPLGSKALLEQLNALPDPSVDLGELLELAGRFPHPDGDPALLRFVRETLAGSASGRLSEKEERALLALAKLDGAQGIPFLVDALDGPHAPLIAKALAQTEGPRGNQRLAAALPHPARRPWALRILAVRLARGDAEPQRSAFHAAIAEILSPPKPDAKSSASHHRAAAAWALAVAAPEDAGSLLTNQDPVLIHAAARQAFRGPLAVAAVSALRSPREVPSDALWHALLDFDAAEQLSTARMLGFITEAPPPRNGPLVQALAARTTQRAGLLAEHDQDALLRDVRSWLDSAEPSLRAAAARGLAQAKAPTSLALLGQTLEWDPDPLVRRAAAWALVQRKEPARWRHLEAAARFDPDPHVRSLARATRPRQEGTSGASPEPLLWIETRDPVQLISAEGESLVLYPDPDGFLGAFGFGPKPWEVRPLQVAKPSSQGDASPEP